MGEPSGESRARQDVQVVSAIMGLALGAVTIIGWIKTWPASVVPAAVGAAGIGGLCFAIWRRSGAATVGFLQAEVTRRRLSPAVVLRLALMYPLLLGPTAAVTVVLYHADSREPLLAAVGLNLAVFVDLAAMRTGAWLRATDGRPGAITAFAQLVLAFGPSFRLTVVAALLALSFHDPWVARGVGVLTVALAGWSALAWAMRRYWDRDIMRAPIPPPRMLAVYLGALPDHRPHPPLRDPDPTSS